MKKDITALYCFVDDFVNNSNQWIKSSYLSNNTRKPTRTPGISHSEILTIVLLYHQSPCKNFKYFYMSYLQLYKSDLNLPSYCRFIALKARILHYLVLLLEWYCHLSKATGLSYIDSTPIAVCHSKRASRNKVFDGIAALGKTSKGWFFGLKLHLLINEIGEIQGLKLTKGNANDRAPVPESTKHITGLLFGDKGYLKQELFSELYNRGLKLVTGIKKNMKNELLPLIL